MRVVLDTNVFISGLVFGRKPLAVLEFVLSGGCEHRQPANSDELERKLSTRFGWHPSAVDAAVGMIQSRATLVSPSLMVSDCVDPADNMFLEAAVEGRADCVVSGDAHLLRMETYRGVAIITVNQFLERIGSDFHVS